MNSLPPSFTLHFLSPSVSVTPLLLSISSLPPSLPPSSYTHPYLLVDNRHYPFYVWKNIFRRHEAVKYLLVPAYSVVSLFFIHALCKCRREGGREAGRQVGRQADRQAGRQTGRQVGRQAGRQAGRQVGRQAGRQAVAT